jgi:hypothetical protein
VDHFGDPPQIFRAVGRAETKIPAKAVPNVIAVEDVSPATHEVQSFFDGMSQGGFAGPGKTGEPQI